MASLFQFTHTVIVVLVYLNSLMKKDNNNRNKNQSNSNLVHRKYIQNDNVNGLA